MRRAEIDTASNSYRVFKMIRSAFLIGVLVAGCSRPNPPTIDAPAGAAEPVAKGTAEPVMEPVTPAVQPTPTPVPAAPTEFVYPPDLTGKQLPRVVAPAAPPIPATEAFGKEPTVHKLPAKLVEPDALSRTVLAPAPLALPAPASVLPVSPMERVPADLGFGAEDVPAKVKFPVGPGISVKARDVNLPPDLPTLGRPQADRASLEDPTMEVSNAAIVTSSTTPTLLPSAFQKVSLPDPFELAEQVKPNVPAAAEPLLIPVPVDSKRVK